MAVEPSATATAVAHDPWSHARWLLALQIALPVETTVMARTNANALTFGLDLRMVLTCDHRTDAGSSPGEVTCPIEAATLRLAPAPERVVGASAEVAADVAHDLTGARVALFLTPDGRIREVQLEGFPADRPRERDRQLAIRRIVNVGVRGLDLFLPTGKVETAWQEPASRAICTMYGPDAHDLKTSFHVVGDLDGDPVVEGAASGVLSSGLGDLTVTFDTLARFDAAHGSLEERAWSLTAVSTATTGMVRADLPYYHLGRLRRLGADEQVDLGTSGYVAPPNTPMADRPAWPTLAVTAFDEKR